MRRGGEGGGGRGRGRWPSEQGDGEGGGGGGEGHKTQKRDLNVYSLIFLTLFFFPRSPAISLGFTTFG